MAGRRSYTQADMHTQVLGQCGGLPGASWPFCNSHNSVAQWKERERKGEDKVEELRRSEGIKKAPNWVLVTGIKSTCWLYLFQISIGLSSSNLIRILASEYCNCLSQVVLWHWLMPHLNCCCKKQVWISWGCSSQVSPNMRMSLCRAHTSAKTQQCYIHTHS